MKLVAVARVKNEVDIIESFVRHHVQHFDKVIVLDDGSSDGTYEVLQQLRAIYCDFIILRKPTIGYMQHQYMTLLLRMAVDKFGADWVAPLDADEFIEPADRMVLPEVLAGRQPALYRLGWCNFVWNSELEQSEERNPVLRQRLRFPPRLDHTKLLVHAQFVSGTAELSLGSHVLTDGGLPIPTEPLDGVQLCHYPVRSVAQYAGKIAVGYLQYLATPDWDRAFGFHYIKPFQSLVKGGLHAIKNRMKQDSLFYPPDESKNEQNNPQATEAPLNYLGGPLTLTPRRGSTTLPNVLGHAEMMATELAVNLKRSRTFDRLSTEYAVLQKRFADVQEKAAQQAQHISDLEHARSQLQREHINLQERAAQQARQLQSRTFRFLTRVHRILIRAKIFHHRG